MLASLKKLETDIMWADKALESALRRRIQDLKKQ